MAMVGGVVSATSTSIEQDEEQMPLTATRLSVNVDPQAAPETTFTVWAFVAPEMLPFPVTDHL
jgi:hypothetical protein